MPHTGRTTTTSTHMMRIVNQTSQVRPVSLYFGHLSVLGSPGSPGSDVWVCGSSYHTHHHTALLSQSVRSFRCTVHCTLVTATVKQPKSFSYILSSLYSRDLWNFYFSSQLWSAKKRAKCSVQSVMSWIDRDSDETIPWNWTVNNTLYFKTLL